ncbi:porin family protein [Flavobacterium sp. WW92]|uniref:porin family protein n=1 Tax=unclassified Flavobacterium TaxID=196869 RepID=UPI002224C2BF|nr:MULTISPECIES: porin family protein [unclassified Flavobacterium]WDO14385.1 porin family protein [Flavobacterium sp. WW92]
MKRLINLSVLLLTISSFAQAPLEKGKIQLNAGFGTSNWSTPIYFGADYMISNPITVGLEASYQSYTTYGIKSTIIGLQANGNYHFNELLEISNEWDAYAGLNLNYYNWKFKDSDTNTYLVDDEPFGVGVQIGGRYFFNEKFAINLELRSGNVTTGGKIGITYLLN